MFYMYVIFLPDYPIHIQYMNYNKHTVAHTDIHKYIENPISIPSIHPYENVSSTPTTSMYIL